MSLVSGNTTVGTAATLIDGIAWHNPVLLHIHNNEEIDSLTTIVRDANGMIVDPLHTTLPFISRYERARVLGERAKQLNSGAIPFVEIDETMIDGYLIALKEFEEKKIPFIIQRPLPNGACEYWKLKDLEIL
jgi:DNA-directed RNA polymerase I, II, and III subunit RPABC2